MIELILGTYGLVCWLLFKKFKVVPVNTYTIFTAILGGVVLLLMLSILTANFHPVSNDGRMYAAVVQIVPNVRGTVIEVPVTPNAPLKEGDVLFKLDPRPFQFEVDRLRAVLVSRNDTVSKLSEQLAAAEFATAEAHQNLIATESQYDRQARLAWENAKAQVKQTEERVKFSEAEVRRYQSIGSSAVSQQEMERALSQKSASDQELLKAKADEQTFDEKVKSGPQYIQAARARWNGAKEKENEVRKDYKSKIDGVNPEVRQVAAELDKARWDLEQTVVRAPSDGYVPQVILRPGQVATTFATRPVMVFIPNERPALIATFPQAVIKSFKPGMEAELAFKAHPGRTFKAKLLRIHTAIREGEVDASGQLVSATVASLPGYIPVQFEYGDDVAELNLPIGAQVSVAVYTESFHALSIVRKIVFRIKSWENYLFFAGH